MRKADIVTRVSDLTGVAKVDVLVALEAFFKEVKNSLKEGENVYVRGFGSFVTKSVLKKSGELSSVTNRLLSPSTIYRLSNRPKLLLMQ
jgi:nucleoid DNA-binding protein